MSEIDYRMTVEQDERPYANADLRYLSVQEVWEEINGLMGQKGFMGAKRKLS